MAKLLFAKAFDKDYFGKAKLPGILEAALRNRDGAAVESKRKPKELSHSLFKAGTKDARAHPTLVFPAAANVGSGRIEAADPREAVVDALCASTAFAPIFGAQMLKHGAGPRGLSMGAM